MDKIFNNSDMLSLKEDINKIITEGMSEALKEVCSVIKEDLEVLRDKWEGYFDRNDIHHQYVQAKRDSAEELDVIIKHIESEIEELKGE